MHVRVTSDGGLTKNRARGVHDKRARTIEILTFRLTRRAPLGTSGTAREGGAAVLEDDTRREGGYE